jgi:hypothetical protein
MHSRVEEHASHGTKNLTFLIGKADSSGVKYVALLQ